MRELRGFPSGLGAESEGTGPAPRVPLVSDSSPSDRAPPRNFDRDGIHPGASRIQRLEVIHGQLVAALRKEAKQVATLLVTGLLRPVIICMLTATLLSFVLTSSSFALFPRPVSPLTAPSLLSPSSSSDPHSSEGDAARLPSFPSSSSLRQTRSLVRDFSRGLGAVCHIFSSFCGIFFSTVFDLSLDVLIYVAVLTFCLALAVRRGWHRFLYYVMASSASFSLAAGCGGAIYLFTCRYLQPEEGGFTANASFSSDTLLADKNHGVPPETDAANRDVIGSEDRKRLCFFLSHLIGLLAKIPEHVSTVSFLPQPDTVLVLVALWNLSLGGAFVLLWLAPIGIRSQLLVAISVASAFTLHVLLLHFGVNYSPESPSTPTTVLLLCMAAWDLFAVLSPWGPLRWILQGTSAADARPMPLLAYEASVARPLLSGESVRSAPMAPEPTGPGVSSVWERPSGMRTPGALRLQAEPRLQLEQGETATVIGYTGSEARVRVRLLEPDSIRNYLVKQNMRLEPLEAGFIIQDERARVHAETRRRQQASYASAAPGDSQPSSREERSSPSEARRKQPCPAETQSRGSGETLRGVHELPVAAFGQLSVRTLRGAARGGAEPRVIRNAEREGEGRHRTEACLATTGRELKETIRDGEKQEGGAHRKFSTHTGPPRNGVTNREERGGETVEGQPAAGLAGHSGEGEAAEERERTLEIEIAVAKRQLHRLRRGNGRAMLGLGDFVFYSLLACNLTSWSFEAGLAASVAVWAGLVITSLGTTFGSRPFLPALPLSIILGLGVGAGIFYFVEPQADFLISVDAFF
ncbi:conserved hypothetical protein [Neospora caninum Liverpool]|uniref:Presenilin 1, putative n=1 Tax=Neospora caninum (strain Liverpool) TaxID=572307 RepID=F0VF25_NEOCL|nr:conserved hypothetical protein [Neospora caninum Liverpool]CBZ52319.1 conserved hypothetical protein [Neospora caninum Liverpool]CEL66287.1 TPA: presenilin 1, putative [Neospora caninum Liverpool]|eukprot:XP_003882351.1 conserved hypothetical protein [Neospora caninum Liverpool]